MCLSYLTVPSPIGILQRPSVFESRTRSLATDRRGISPVTVERRIKVDEVYGLAKRHSYFKEAFGGRGVGLTQFAAGFYAFEEICRLTPWLWGWFPGWGRM